MTATQLTQEQIRADFGSINRFIEGIFKQINAKQSTLHLDVQPIIDGIEESYLKGKEVKLLNHQRYALSALRFVINDLSQGKPKQRFKTQEPRLSLDFWASFNFNSLMDAIDIGIPQTLDEVPASYRQIANDLINGFKETQKNTRC